MSDERNLTATELADRLDVSADSVRRWSDAGKIPSYRTGGGHRRFHLHAVREALGMDAAEAQAEATS